MKITIIATFLLSAVCMVYAQQYDSGFRLPMNGGSTERVKGFIIRCSDNAKAIVCSEGLIKIQAPVATPNMFSQVAKLTLDKQVAGKFKGTCAATIQAIRNASGCGIEDCPAGNCYA